MRVIQINKFQDVFVIMNKPRTERVQVVLLRDLKAKGTLDMIVMNDTNLYSGGAEVRHIYEAQIGERETSVDTLTRTTHCNGLVRILGVMLDDRRQKKVKEQLRPTVGSFKKR